MNVNMDMDVAWCLTCSKRTRDPRSTYCSEACRTADQGASSSTTSAPFTSPLPAGMYSSPLKAKERRDSVSPTKSPLVRPALRALPTVAGTVSVPMLSGGSAITDSLSVPIITGVKRDRRAFSFPDPPASDSLTFTRRHARQSTVLSPANKRSIMAALTPISQPVPDKRLLQVRGRKSAVSTGGLNTPLGNDSVFCSTSDSSDDGCEHIEYKSAPASAAMTVPLAAMPTLPTVAQPSTLPKLAADQFSSLRSQLSSGRANSLHSREASHSPVAAMIASSASSRSREDIMSWRRGIRARPEEEEDGQEQDRGRPRNRRLTSVSGARPNEVLQESDEEEAGVEEDVTGSGLGTTPKGRMGSALSGLGMTYGVGSIVKALTAATTSPSKAIRADTHSIHAPDSPAPPLTALPSAASVSRVAVFAHTNPSLPLEEATSQFHPGTTPTLSTLSFSEVVDFSVQGTHDQADIVTDDGGMSATSSTFARRVSMAGKMPPRPQRHSLSNSSVHTPPPVETPLPPRNSLPRPLVTTASALWSMTSYFARFAPFSIPLVTAPFSAGEVSGAGTPAKLKSGIATPAKVGAQAVEILQPRSREDSPMEPAQELVRSLPMNIIPPVCSTDEDWERNRQRLQEQAQMAHQRSSRSRARSKSRRRGPTNRIEEHDLDLARVDTAQEQRGRSSRRGREGRESREPRRADSRSSSPGEWAVYRKAVISPEPAVGSTNQDPDADADVSADEGLDEPRGRRGRVSSLRRKGLANFEAHPRLSKLGVAEQGDDQGAVSNATETERGRGRSRSVRPGARAA